MSSQHPVEEEACPLVRTLGPTGQSLGPAQLVATTQFARLAEARVHMGASQVFLKEIHFNAFSGEDRASGQGFLFLVGLFDLVGRAGLQVVQAATSHLRGLPLGLLRATTAPDTRSWPPQTPHGSRRSSAPARHSVRTGQVWHKDFASSTSAGDSAKKSSGSLVRQGRLEASVRSLASASMTLSVMLFTSSEFSSWSDNEKAAVPSLGIRGLEVPVMTVIC